MSIDPLDGVGQSTFQRNDLEKIGLNPRSVRTLEGLPLDRDALTQAVDQVIGEVNKLDAAPVIVWEETDPQLSEARVLTETGNISVSVTGSEVLPDLKDTTVSPGDYGAPTKLVVLAIDAKGRITAASEVALESGNVTETTKLFFTNARARAALSAGSHIGYSGGVISFAGTGVSGTFTSPTSITVDDGLITAIS